MHILRNEEKFFPSFLSPWLLKHHTSSLYQDTTVHCKDKMMLTNRLVVGLIFPQLASWDGFTFLNPVEVILPEWNVSEIEHMIESFFVIKEVMAKDEKNDNCDDDSSNEVHTVEKDMEFKNDIEVLNITDRPKCKEKWTCHICSMSFNFVNGLQEHTRNNHETANFLKCQYCDFETNSNRNLKRHENNHTKPNQFACDECGKTYSDKGDLKKHKTSHAGPVQCDLCDKTVKSTFRLSRHISSMHGDDAESGKFICEVCSSTLRTKEYLKRHMKNVHCGYSFMCSICDKKFKTKYHLTQHEEYHSDDTRTTECKVCGTIIKGERKRTIEIHMETHSKTNYMKCEKCEYYFRWQTNLIKHNQMYHGQ